MGDGMKRTKKEGDKEKMKRRRKGKKGREGVLGYESFFVSTKNKMSSTFWKQIKNEIHKNDA